MCLEFISKNFSYACFLPIVAKYLTFFFSVKASLFTLRFLFYSANEENVKKKKLSGDSSPKNAKTLEKTVDTNEALQQNSRTETKNTNNTIHDSEGENKNREIPEELNSPLKQEQKSQKDKEELRKRKQKQGSAKRKRLTFKEMKELAVKRRLQRQFRGAKKEQLSNLSAARLASYGLTKKKKKKS